MLVETLREQIADVETQKKEQSQECDKLKLLTESYHIEKEGR